MITAFVAVGEDSGRCFVDKSALKSITDSECYDLAPTWENYYRLTDSGKGLGPYSESVIIMTG